MSGSQAQHVINTRRIISAFFAMLIVIGTINPVVGEPKILPVQGVETHWAKSSIERIVTMTGWAGKGQFYPDLLMDRAQAAMIIANLLELPTALPTTPSFWDVPITYWAYPQIEAVAKSRLMPEAGTDKYGPNGYISRVQLMGIANRLGGIRSIRLLIGQHWYSDAIAANCIPPTWLKDPGFQPYVPVTRAEWLYVIDKTQAANRYAVQLGFPNQDVAISNPALPRFWLSRSSIVAESDEPIAIYAQYPDSSSPNIIYADLSAVGRIGNLPVCDDGQWADSVANDQIYTGQFRLSPLITPGLKTIVLTIELPTGIQHETLQLDVLGARLLKGNPL